LPLHALLLFAVAAPACSASKAEGTSEGVDTPAATAPIPSSARISEGAGEGTGHFEVQLTNGSLVVTHDAQPGKVLFATAAQGFLSAAVGREKVDSRRGCFVFEDRPTSTCGNPVVESFSQEGAAAVARGTLRDCGASFSIRFEERSARQLAFEARVEPTARARFDRVGLTYTTSKNESFYGFGHQYTYLDMKGRKLPIWSGEQGIGRGQQPISGSLSLVGGGCAGDWSTSYTAVPAYQTSEGRGLVLENEEYLTFDLTRDDTAKIEVWGPAVRGRVLQGEKGLDLLTSLTEYTGRMTPLPAWTQSGALLRVRGGSAAARAKLAEAKAAGARIAALWIEDWAGERETAFGLRMLWNWEVDRGLYPDWEQLVPSLAAEGVRVVIYLNPFLADAAGWQPARRNLYAEAKAQGLLVKKADGSVYAVGNGGFEAGMVDLTNPAARDFLADVMKAQLAVGVSGWMADFGEALPWDAQLASGVDARLYHNAYPYEWARLNRETIAAAGRESEVFFFNRSGNVRSPQQTRAFWLGDQNTTWDANDGMRTVLPGLLSGGLSGYTIDHADIGGWLSVTIPFIGFKRTKELQQRWLELGAFGALFRLHPTNKPDDNWQYDSDPETLRLFARMTRLFAALAPLRAGLMDEAASKGWPLVRHPFLHAGDDPRAWELTQQFNLGPDVMVAPVVDKGKTTVAAYLPAGEWVLVWNGSVYGSPSAGSSVTLPAPIGQPPLLVRKGSASGAALVDRMRAEGLL
jgi:alpha-glucosidase